MSYVNKFFCILLFLFLFSTNGNANQIEKDVIKYKIDNTYAEMFSSLIVQSKDGRMKPLDSLNLDILNKISSKREFYNLNYNQVILGMMFTPEIWKDVPIYKINNYKIKELLNIKENTISFNSLFDLDNNYKLQEHTNITLMIEEKEQSSYEKELNKLYEKVQISKFIYNKGFLKIFPLKDTINDKWYSPLSLKDEFTNDVKIKAQLLYVNNKKSTLDAINNNNWEEALKTVEDIKLFQKEYGSKIIPSENKLKLEQISNDILLFEKLYYIYFILGLLYLSNIFLNILLKKEKLRNINNIFKYTIFIVFSLHTINLILRWYVSGHAPWSNAYESMIFISWTILFAGLFFAKSSKFALATTTLTSSFLLFSAHLSFMDPQITNLVPSLQSYWLTIHVAIISASYGFLALSALLGIITLILYLLINEKNKTNLYLNVKECIKINEQAMILGFYLLIVGTLLGSVWANESWGRIWGWDPKESWSLASILVYMMILHIRMLTKIESDFLFTSLSIISYNVILMTYFGVNYFFDAIHVYASSSNASIPSYYYITLLSIFVMILLAYKKNTHFKVIN